MSQKLISGSKIPHNVFKRPRSRSVYRGAQRRRMHYLLDLVIDDRGLNETCDAIREWLELAIDNERFNRHFAGGAYTGPKSAERILSALEGYRANSIEEGEICESQCMPRSAHS